jgi:hypothetical protein
VKDYFNPLDSYNNFKDFLSRFNEYEELDQYVIFYLDKCLQKRVIRRPAKGRSGEQGKDIVVVDSEEEKTYCSFVVKKGNLDNSLDHPRNGVLKQMNDAMFIDLEESEFKRKKRTVVVVYNGIEKKRSTITKYETTRTEIENLAKKSNILSREIERWNIDILASKLFPYRELISDFESFKNLVSAAKTALDIVVDFKVKFEGVILYNNNKLGADALLADTIKEISKLENNYGPLQKYVQKKV